MGGCSEPKMPGRIFCTSPALTAGSGIWILQPGHSGSALEMPLLPLKMLKLVLVSMRGLLFRYHVLLSISTLGPYYYPAASPTLVCNHCLTTQEANIIISKQLVYIICLNNQPSHFDY